jgi:hypothetical protein
MSAQSVTEPIPQFHNRDGQPLDGGFIYVGTAGLDAQANQIQIYLDPALTIPFAQPVQTLNGYPSNGGTPVAFYAGVGNFSIKIVDAQGLLVLSAPNVTTRLDAANLTGSISAAIVSFLQAGAGAIARTVQDKLRDVVSVFDFMTAAQIAAVKASTFLVDVTTPINAAISSGAREVFFPQGGYLISAPINIGATSVGVSLVGAGRQSTVIRNTGAGTPAVQSIGNAILNNTSIRIADMSIEGQAGTGDGVLLDYTSQAVLERLDCYTNGLSGIKVQRGSHIAVNDCWSRSNTGNALEIATEAFFVDVKGGTFETSANGLAIDGGGLTPARHVTITGAAFRSANTLNAYIADGATDVRFFGCDFTAAGGTTSVHLSADGFGGATVSGVLVEGCTFVGNNGTTSIIGVSARDCEDVAIVASVLDCTGSTAYDINATAVRTRIFDNNVIAGTQTNASASTVVRSVVALPTPGVAFFTGTSNLPISIQAPNNVPIVRFDDQRVWANANNVYTFNVTPASITDGYIVGPGCDTLTFANLPAAPPVGTRVLCTDCVVNAWGAQVLVGGGAFKRFVIWDGAFWTVFGTAT